MTNPPRDANEQAHLLIARFLSHQNYSATLSSFLEESTSKHPQLRLNPHQSNDEQEDWNDVVEEWIAKKVTQIKLQDGDSKLRDELAKLESTREERMPSKVRTVVKEASNILNVRKGTVPRKEWDSAALEFKSSSVRCIFTTTVDRTIKIWSHPTRSNSSRHPLELLDSHQFPSPVLSLQQHPLAGEEYTRFVACGTMEGRLTILDLVTREKVVQIKDHTKYIVKVAWSPDGRHIATLGYDKLIHVYFVSHTPAPSDSDSPTIALSLVHTLHPRTNPEAAVFLPDSSHLVWTARDDHLLHYLSVPSPNDTSDEPWRMTEYNLNPNQDSFTSFSILSLSLHPVLPLLSLQTSTTSARIFLYPFHSSNRLKTIHTGAQQSDYFNPRHVWSEKGDMVVVNSEDGIVRVCGLSLEGGKERLRKGCHGVAAPLKDDEDDEEEGKEEESEELKSERAKARRERDRGSSVVRDVEIVELDEGGWVVFCAGFDKTVRMIV